MSFDFNLKNIFNPVYTKIELMQLQQFQPTPIENYS